MNALKDDHNEGLTTTLKSSELTEHSEENCQPLLQDKGPKDVAESMIIKESILDRVKKKAQEPSLKLKLSEMTLIGACRLITGLKASFKESLTEGPVVFYANHQSHLDGLALWSSLPKKQRLHTHPIAAKSYWSSSQLKKFIAQEVFNALLIDREKETRTIDPIELMALLLKENESLIIFPEGTRGSGEQIQPFKSGIYHLAKSMPHVLFIPVYLHNLHRVMPKGSKLIVPILCDVRFGAALDPITPLEDKGMFLSRAFNALEALKHAI